MRGKLKDIVSGAGFLAIVYLISRFLGLIREMAIAYRFGAGQGTDVYNASFLLPDVLNYLLAAGAFGIVLVPMLTRHSRGDSLSEEGSKVFSAILGPMTLVAILLVILAEIFAPRLTALLYPDFAAHPDKFDLAVNLTRIVLPAQFFFIVGGLINATLRARGDFRGSWGAGVYNLGIVLGALVLGKWAGIAGLSAGALIGACLGPFLVPWWLSRKTMAYRLQLDFNSPYFKEFLKLNLPLMIGVSLLTVDEWYVRYFGAMRDVPEGTLTCLKYARTLMLIPIALVGQTAGQASLTYLSRLLGEQKNADFCTVLGRTIRGVLFCTFIMAGGMAVLAVPLVILIFQRGAFDLSHAVFTASLLSLLCLGIPAFAAQSVLLNGYYCRKQTLRPMVINSLVAVSSIPVYWACKKFFAGPGLAIATGISLWAMFLSTLVDYHFRYGRREGFATASIVASVGKGLLVSAAGVAAGYLLSKAIPVTPFDKTGALFHLVLGGIFYLIAAASCIKLLGGEEYRALRALTGRT